MNRSSLLLSVALAVTTVFALPVCGWFVVHSNAFASYLQTTLDRNTRPGVLSFGGVQAGPLGAAGQLELAAEVGAGLGLVGIDLLNQLLLNQWVPGY